MISVILFKLNKNYRSIDVALHHLNKWNYWPTVLYTGLTRILKIIYRNWQNVAPWGHCWVILIQCFGDFFMKNSNSCWQTSLYHLLMKTYWIVTAIPDGHLNFEQLRNFNRKTFVMLMVGNLKFHKAPVWLHTLICNTERHRFSCILFERVGISGF